MGSTQLLCVLTLSPYHQAMKHHVEGKEDATKHKPLYGTLAGLYYGMLPAQLDSHWHTARHWYRLGLGGELLM